MTASGIISWRHLRNASRFCVPGHGSTTAPRVLIGAASPPSSPGDSVRPAPFSHQDHVHLPPQISAPLPPCCPSRVESPPDCPTTLPPQFQLLDLDPTSRVPEPPCPPRSRASGLLVSILTGGPETQRGSSTQCCAQGDREGPPPTGNRQLSSVGQRDL